MTNAADPFPRSCVWKGRALCVAAALLWSTSGVFIKKLTASAPVGAGWSGWQTAGLRSLIAAAVLIALARSDAFLNAENPRRLERWNPRTFLPTRPQAVIACFLAPTVLLYAFAQAYTSTAAAIFLQYTAPIYVMALAPWLLKESARRRDILAMMAIAAGMAFILPGEILESRRIGNALAVVSGICFAGVILSMRRWRDGSGAMGAAWGNVLAAIAALSAALWLPSGFVPLDLSSGAQILFLGVFQMGVPYFLFQRSLQFIPAAEAAVLILLEPAACPLWSYLFLKEKPPASALYGGALILAALAFHAMASLQSSAPKRG